MSASLVKTLVSKALDALACAELDSGPEYAAEFQASIFEAAVQHINSERETASMIPRSCYADGGRVHGDGSSYSDDELRALARDAEALLAGLGLDVSA